MDSDASGLGGGLRYPNEDMTRHEGKFLSIRRLIMFVAVLTCISFLVVGRLWLAGAHNRRKASVWYGFDRSGLASLIRFKICQIA